MPKVTSYGDGSSMIVTGRDHYGNYKQEYVPLDWSEVLPVPPVGWYVFTGKRLRKFDTEFAAKMFAAGWPQQKFLGYGRIEINHTTGKKTFQELSRP